MRLAIRFLVVLLAGSATFLVSRILSAQTSQPAFWLQQIERATNKQREGSAGKVRYFAQRSDGSNVRGVTESDFSKVPEEREIVLLPERKRIVVSDASKTISTMYLTDVEEAVFRSRMSTAASSKCAPANFKAAAYLGEDSYTGLLVHKYRAVQASQAVRSLSGKCGSHPA